MAAVAIVGGLVGFADDLLAAWVGERFLLDLRVHVFGHLQRVGLHALDRRRLGDLLSRVTSDVQAIESFVLAGVSEGIAAVLRLGFFTGALFLLEWRLALAALVVVPMFWLVARTFGRLLKRAAREKRRRTGSLTAIAEERLAAAALVQTHGREAHETERLAAEGRRIVAAEMTATRIRGLSTPVIDLIELLGAAIVIALGTWALSAGSLTLGGLLAFLAYLSRMYGPARDLGSLSTTIFAAAAGAERVLEVLAERPSVEDRPDARPVTRVRGELELEGVRYTHPGSADEALRGVDLHVRAGECVALVGPSGAGKSTLAKLLVRLDDPTAGAVRLDGQDLRDLQLAGVRDAVAVLLQETLLLDATVRENVAYGRPTATDDEVRAALAAAGYPDADLDARVGQRGRSLSGGQARRVALARTLLRDAPVVVLDEPTTGLDAATRDALLPALARVVAGRTAVIVTHDPAVAALADREVVVEGGRLLEGAAA
jgi:ATP-binding cassette, subfamily B, bacterial